MSDKRLKLSGRMRTVSTQEGSAFDPSVWSVVECVDHALLLLQMAPTDNDGNTSVNALRYNKIVACLETAKGRVR